MAIRRIVAKLENTNVDRSNYALVGFTFDSTVAEDEAAARVAAYIMTVSAYSMAAGTRLVGLNIRAAGAAGGVDLPFPVEIYPEVRDSLIDEFPTLPVPAATDYGLAIGGGALAPLGSSVSVSEVTATVGRTGRGRHYLPYFASTGLNAAGSLRADLSDAIKEVYTDIFMSTVPGPPLPMTPMGMVVCGANLTVPKPITIVKAQPVLSNLESRRR